MMKPKDILEKAMDIFGTKSNKDNYKDGYIRFGDMMMAIYPKGLTIKTKNHWVILGIFIQIMSKVLRLGTNIFEDKDSAVEKRSDNSMDLVVYSAMLTSVLPGDTKPTTFNAKEFSAAYQGAYPAQENAEKSNPVCWGKYKDCTMKDCFYALGCKSISKAKKPTCFGIFFTSPLDECSFACNFSKECKMASTKIKNEDIKNRYNLDCFGDFFKCKLDKELACGFSKDCKIASTKIKNEEKPECIARRHFAKEYRGKSIKERKDIKEKGPSCLGQFYKCDLGELYCDFEKQCETESKGIKPKCFGRFFSKGFGNQHFFKCNDVCDFQDECRTEYKLKRDKVKDMQ